MLTSCRVYLLLRSKEKDEEDKIAHFRAMQPPRCRHLGNNHFSAAKRSQSITSLSSVVKNAAALLLF
jgi:hypothetical protein